MKIGHTTIADGTHFQTFLRAIELTSNRKGILGDECLVYPPKPDYGYSTTPLNAITFGSMGVDGVHYAILAIDRVVTDQSPVIHISPMDFSEPYALLGESFLSYLAAACDVSIGEMELVFEDEREGLATLAPFLRRNFKSSRALGEQRLRKLAKHLKFIEPKPETC